MSLRSTTACLVLCALPLRTVADVARTISLPPGSLAEAASVLSGAGTTLEADARRASPGGAWTYRFVVPPSARCALTLTVEGEPEITVQSSEGKPIAVRVESGAGLRIANFTAPAKHPLGAGLRVRIRAVRGEVVVRGVQLTVRLADTNGDGVSDLVEGLMGLAPGEHTRALPTPQRPHAALRTAVPWDPAIALPADMVLLDKADTPLVNSWAQWRYQPIFAGSLLGQADEVKSSPAGVQLGRGGTPAGPVVEAGWPAPDTSDTARMVPTQARTDAAAARFAEALRSGAAGVAAFDAGYWVNGGYEDDYKQEWKARFNAPWQAPADSMDARWRAEGLKAALEQRRLQGVTDAAKKASDLSVRMVGVPSPLAAGQQGLNVPFGAVTAAPDVTDVVGMVDANSAAAPGRAGGVRASRLFEEAYLQYSALAHQFRGTGKRLWFSVDLPNSSSGSGPEEARQQYEKLVAAALFQDVDNFVTLAYPERLFGKAPGAAATEVTTLASTLADLWQSAGPEVDGAAAGIGVACGESMAWQRAQPDAATGDGFPSLALPLVTHGVPVQAVALDRATDAAYLDRLRVLVLSYDFLKPASAAVNRAVADWVRRGGSLVLVGGEDPYAAVKEAWWNQAGAGSPTRDLLAQLGLPAGTPRWLPAAGELAADQYTTVLSGEAGERQARNRRMQKLDITSYVRDGSVLVRFGALPGTDDPTALLGSVELRINGRLAAAFRAGSELETRFLADESGSIFTGDARVVEGDGHWTYRFDSLPAGAKIELSLDLANGYRVGVAQAPARGALLRAADGAFGPLLSGLRLTQPYGACLPQPPSGARPLFNLAADGRSVAWQAPVGRGNVLYVGTPPAYFSATAQSSAWLRALVKRAAEAVGAPYAERDALVARRGPYTAVAAVGDDYTLEGRYANLFSPTLAMVDDPVVNRQSVGLFAACGRERGVPHVVAVSGRLRAKAESGRATGVLVEGPYGSDCAVRIWCGRRTPRGVRAYTLLGLPVAATFYPDGDSVLVRFKNAPDGVAARVSW